MKAGVAAGIAAAEGEDTEVAPKRKEKKEQNPPVDEDEKQSRGGLGRKQEIGRRSGGSDERI